MNDNNNGERASASLAAPWLNPPLGVLSSSFSSFYSSSYFSFSTSTSFYSTSTPFPSSSSSLSFYASTSFPSSPFTFSPPPLSVLHLAARENEVAYDVVAVIDPLTREAQKISSLLTVSL